MNSQRLRVAVLGANGQVGAEICLLLARRNDIDLVPICRTRSGSAFLRWLGIACRHGRPAYEGEGLFSDCDVIINSALATGTPSEIRTTEDRIIRSAFRHSAPHAVVIHFSTQSVYGDANPGRAIRWKSPYGRTKLATEKTVRHEARVGGKRAYIFRLGHVCGALQNISLDIQDQIRNGRVVFPERDCLSNTTFTVTIVDAIAKVLDNSVAPGTYDLMNSPQWTWKQVYAYEAEMAACSLMPKIAPARAPTPTLAGLGLRTLRAVASSLASMPWVHQHGSKAMAYMPTAANQRMQAWWNRRRALSEIASIQQPIRSPEFLSWLPNGDRWVAGLTPTVELLRGRPYQDFERPIATPWPADLSGARTKQDGVLRTPEH